MRVTIDRILVVTLTLASTAIAGVLVRREFAAAPQLSRQTRKPPTYEKDWQAMLAPGVQGVPVRSPRVTIVEFVDFECPFCREFNSAVRAVQAKYGDVIQVAVVHFPLEMHRFARPAARAAECAAVQGRFDQFVDAVYTKQDSLGLKGWTSYALEGGVRDTIAFAACNSSRAPVRRVEEGLAVGRRFGVYATPTVIVNGWRYDDPPNQEELERFISSVLAGREPFPGGPKVASGS